MQCFALLCVVLFQISESYMSVKIQFIPLYDGAKIYANLLSAQKRIVTCH